jgi:hypothetical protein
VNSESPRDRAIERLLRGAGPDPAAPSTAACLDAESLAAWSSGAIRGDAHRAIETHLSSCTRCQSMLALFLQSEPVPAPNAPFWRSPARWLIPLAAAASAVLLWVVLPDRPPAPSTALPTAARLEPAPVPPAIDSAADRVTAPSERGAGAAPTSRRDDTPAREETPAEARERNFSRGAAPLEKADLGEDRQPAAPAAAAPSGRRADAVSEQAAVSAARAGNESAVGRLQSAVVLEIVSPDPARRWRIQGREVQLSTNGGSTWSPAMLPAGSVATGGAAPLPSVCWLIGPAGTVLRTTDGVRFESVPVPGAGLLTSIQADDASRARVTAADGRVFTTTDGGVSWR